MQPEMVRATLDGRKNHTRRVMKPQPAPEREAILARFPQQVGCPYGQPGDLLYVRESFAPIYAGPIRAIYRADGEKQNGACCGCGWKPSIHMPRWASRITLRIKEVRVERVQNISEEDAIAEGCVSTARMIYEGMGGPVDYKGKFAYDHFAELWDSINAKRGYGWDANPWVWVLVFDVIKKNVDKHLSEESLQPEKMG